MDQNTLIIILIGVIVVGFIFFFRQLQELKEKKDDKSQEVLMKWLEEMRSSVDKNTDTLQRRLDSTNKAINESICTVKSIFS